MAEPTTRASVLKFGTFEIDVAAGELRKNGRRVPLPGQPFALLAALVENPGAVVTRDDLKDRLWPGDTYVDFDRSLNTAASKVRDALGDSASSPRFIETLPRRGYRFLASVEGLKTQPVTQGAREGTVSNPDTARGHASQAQLRWAWSVAALALALAVGTVVMQSFEAEPPAPTRRFSLSLPGWSHSLGMVSIAPAISPDSQFIVYESEDNRKLAVWDLARGSRRVLEGTERAHYSFWSPDSRFIAFSTEGGSLNRVPVQGGPVVRICDTTTGLNTGLGSWSLDGNSIVIQGLDGLYEVSAAGGDPRLVLPNTAVGDDSRLSNPHFILGAEGRLLLVVAKSGPESSDKLLLVDLDTKQVELIAQEPGIGLLTYSPSGHIVYEADQRLVKALPFSLETREATGEPILIAENASYPTVALDQTLVFRDGSSDRQSLLWVDRQGRTVGKIGESQPAMWYPSLSPDELRVVSSGNGNAWVHEVQRPIVNKLPFDGAAQRAVWVDAGREILFTSRTGLYVQPFDGSEEATLFYDSEGYEFLSDQSEDGTYTLYDLDGKDIWYLERQADDRLEAKPFLATGFVEKAAQISPDNRWVAYVADDTGTYEVYLRRFPEADRRTKVSENVGPGLGDGGPQTLHSSDGYRRLLLRSAEPLATRIERKHERTVEAVLPQGNRLVATLPAGSRPGGAPPEREAPQDAGV